MKNTEAEQIAYLVYFHDMVTMGIVTGLETPQEWIVQYARGIGKSYKEMEKIQNFCDEVSKDLCSLEIQKDEDKLTEEDLKQWFDSVYKKNTGLRLVPLMQEKDIT